MVNKTCFIANCSTKPDGENGRVSFFRPPKNFFKQWEDVIPKKGLCPSSRLCSLHFDDDDIIKGRTIGDTFFEQKLWRLKTGALPKHLLDMPSTRKQHPAPSKNLVTTQVDSTKKKSCKGHMPVQSILGSASQQTSATNDKADSSVNSEIGGNVLVVNMLTEVHEDASFILPIPISSNDSTSLAASSTEPSQNNIDMSGSSIESDALDTEAESGVNAPNAQSVSFSTEDRDESLSIASSTEPEPNNVEITDSSVETNILVNLVEPDVPIDIEFFQEMKANVKLPSGWNWAYNRKSKSAVCITWLTAPDGSLNMKTICIRSPNRVSFHFGEKTILMPTTTGMYQNFDQLSDSIASFHRQKHCRGILNPALNNVNVTEKCSVYKDGEVWRSTECTFLAVLKSNTSRCIKCANMVRYLRKKLKNQKNPANPNRKLDVANQKIRRMQAKEMIISMELENMQRKCNSLLAHFQRTKTGAKQKKVPKK